MMQKSDYVTLGYFSKARGLQGEIKAVMDVFDIQEYRQVKRLFIARKEEPLREIQVKKFKIQSQKLAVLKVEGVNDRESAEALQGHTIYFPEAELPPLGDGHFYYFETIGYQIEDENLGQLGTVKDFLDGAAQDILQMAYQGKDVLIPMTRQFVLRADQEARIIYTNLPEGLLELYLED
ncbi:MAG: ribosome maturation factor RimM [Bacteroidota bacterium]